MKGDLSPAFMIDLAHKDLGIALDVANQLHVPMPLGAASREVYNWRGPQAAVGKTGAPSGTGAHQRRADCQRKK